MTKSSLRTIAALIATVAMLAGCDRFTSVETRMTRASTQLEAGEFQAALIDVRKVLDKEPQNIDAQLLLVDVLTRSGETVQALAQLDLATQAGAPPAATEVRRLELLQARGDAKALRQALEASTTLPPPRRDAFEGHLLLLEQKPAEAAAAFERALSADPTLTDAALGRIEALTAQGQNEPAMKAADALLQANPQSGRAWLLKASLAARSGDFTGANDAFIKALENSQGMGRDQRLLALVGRMDSLFSADKPDAARAVLPELETAAGDSPIVSLMRGRMALADRNADTAVNELRKFVQVAPQHMPSRLLLVAALQEQGSIEQAFAEAVRCVSQFPDRDEPRLALAGVQLRMGRAADAEDTLKPLIGQSPPNPLANAMIADIRIRAGEAEAGIALLEQALTEQPGSSRLKLQLALAQLSAGDARRALQILDTVQDPTLSAARDRLHVIASAALQGPASVAGELDAAIQRHPEDIDLLMMAAAYAANTGRTDQARERLKKALEIRPKDPTLSMALARLELSAGRPAEAETLAKAALEKSPSDSASMVLMAAIAGQRGQEDEVDAWLNRARIANPGALDVSLALARRAIARGQAAQARTILSEAARQAPRNPGARVALAELIASQGDTSDALSELRDAARQNPDSPLVPLSTARVQLAAKNTDGARTSLQQALKLSPGWVPAATMLARIEVGAGNTAKALEVARDVRRADPNGTAADLLTGDIYLAVRQPAQAATAFTAAYQRRPGSQAAIRILQARVQAKLNPVDTELLDWVKRTPADSGARHALADYYLSSGRNDAAVEQLEHVVAARPADALALNNLAWLYQQKNDARALATAEKAYAAAPKSAAVADTYGWIMVQGGKIDEGVKLLTQASGLAPDAGDIRFHLASALARSGKRAEAAEMLRGLVNSPTRFPSRAEAEKLLKELAP